MAKKLNLHIDFTKIPKPARILIAVVPAVLIVVLVIVLSIMPKNKQIDNLKLTIADQEKEIIKTQSVAGRLDDLIAENEKLREKLKKLEQHLPEEGEISSLLKQVSDMGIEAGLEILTWSPGGRRDHPSGIVYEVPVSVGLSGSYHRLGRFFGSLTKLDRIVNIYDINLSSPRFDKGEVKLNVGLTAATFTAASEGGLAK